MMSLGAMLFVCVIEAGSASGTFLPDKTMKVAVVFVECFSPVVNATDGNTHDGYYLIVVISFEDQLATLQPLDRLDG